jgi:hypothetical protein
MISCLALEHFRQGTDLSVPSETNPGLSRETLKVCHPEAVFWSAGPPGMRKT